MAMPKRIQVGHGVACGYGVGLRPVEEGESPVGPVLDFKAPKRDDGSRPQQVDKETGLPLWQVTVMDFDPAAEKREMVMTVKIPAKQQPVPPANNSELPFTPVEFVGLTALPYVDENGPRARIAWSFRAEGMVEPGKAGQKPASAPSSSGPDSGGTPAKGAA